MNLVSTGNFLANNGIRRTDMDSPSPNTGGALNEWIKGHRHYGGGGKAT